MKKIMTGAACAALGFTGLMAGGAAGAATVTTSYTAPQKTNVRTGQGTNYAVFGTVASGTSITGVLQSSGWVKVTSPAADAGKYIYSGVLSAKTTPVSTPTAPSAPSVPTPAPTQPSSGASAASGSTITGWVASSDHSINVRSGPGFNYGISGHIAAQSKVSGTLAGDWIKVAGGYINRGLIETTNANIFNLNGQVSPASMCAVPLAWNSPNSFDPGYTPSTQRYFNCAGLVGLTQLENDYKATFGHYAQIDLTYRTLDEERYWKRVKPNAASPVGTSNHGWGLAVDFRENDAPDEFSWGYSGYKWLAANSAKYGFAGDPVAYGTAEESYHWNFAG